MEKIKNYLGLARRGGNLVIGSDSLEKYDKKLYLILLDEEAGKSSRKIANRFNVKFFEVKNLDELVNIPKCKLIGIKDKGLSEEISKILEKEV